jgi:hypothetical protein
MSTFGGFGGFGQNANNQQPQQQQQQQGTGFGGFGGTNPTTGGRSFLVVARFAAPLSQWIRRLLILCVAVHVTTN